MNKNRRHLLARRADALPWKDWCDLLHRFRKYHHSAFMPCQGKTLRRLSKHINAAYKKAGKPPFIHHPWPIV